ncbi:MAG: tetratricopeptide repeat protein [Bacteroidota bacterium]
MAPDEKNKSKKPDRKHLLEEIRRRAEQAELRRIEDEEQDVRKKDAGVPSEGKAQDSIPVPLPTRAIPPAANQVARDQKLAVLRERLAIAIDRKKTSKASELLEELRKLAPEAPGLPELEQRVAAVQTEAPRERAEPAKEKQPGKKDRPKDLDRQREKLPEWLDSAHSLYQQEKYDEGLEQVKKVLAIEAENEGALRLQEQITRARQIIELVKKEEEKHKAEEAASFPTAEKKEPPPVITHDEKEVWGADTAPEPVESDFELAPEQAGPVAPPKLPLLDRAKERASRITIPWKPILSVVIVVAAGLAGYVIVDYVKHAVAPPEASILVLPPTILRADSNARYITDGLVEGLVEDLSLASAVRVVGVPSALLLRSSSMNPVGKARSVGAGYYLQWNVGRVSDWLALELSLFDTLSPRPIWVSRHQASLKEMSGVRVEIARRVLGAMQVTLDGEEQLLLRRVPTTVAEAYDAFLRGRAALREPERYSSTEAIDFFVQAVRLDSAFAHAQAALGWAWVLAYESEPRPREPYLIEALGCVNRTVLLGWRSSEIFRVWGVAELLRSQYTKALERLEDAVRISPSDAESLRRLAVMYIVSGDFDAAVSTAERAVTVDPNNVASHAVLGDVLLFMGQYVHPSESPDSRRALGAAARAYDRGAPLASNRSAFSSGLHVEALVYTQKPNRAITILMNRVAEIRTSYVDYYKLARVQQAAGLAKAQWEEALVRAKNLINRQLQASRNDARALSYLALVQTRLGQFKEADAASRRAVELAPTHVEVLYNTARMYALQRNTPKALEHLRLAVRSRYNLPQILDMDFYLLRSNPDFLAAVSR